MEWISLIVFLLSYFLAKNNGASTGEAAAIGAAAGLATYYIADPANPDNLMGFGVDAKDVAGDVDIDAGGLLKANGGGAADAIGGVLKTGLSETGSVLKSWGPTGTLTAVAGGTALSKIDSDWWPWIIGAGLVLLVMK